MSLFAFICWLFGGNTDASRFKKCHIKKIDTMNQSNLNALGDGKSPDMLVFSMRMCVVMLMLFLLPFDVFCTQGGMNGDFRESIPTLYPTKDWVVSDFVVTDSRFGAKA